MAAESYPFVSVSISVGSKQFEDCVESLKIGPPSRDEVGEQSFGAAVPHDQTRKLMVRCRSGVVFAGTQTTIVPADDRYCALRGSNSRMGGFGASTSHAVPAPRSEAGMSLEFMCLYFSRNRIFWGHSASGDSGLGWLSLFHVE